MRTMRFTVTLGSIFLAHATLAQPRPMPPDPYDAHQQQQPQPQQAAPVSMTMPQPAYPASNDYPAGEVQIVPAAKARAAMSRVELDNAQSSLHGVVDVLKEDFENSTVLMAALRSEKIAYERYVTARDRVLGQVQSDRRYGTLKNLVSDLQERLYQLKSTPDSNKSEILATAELKLAYATRLSDMENDALKADSSVQDARALLVQASSKVTDLRAQFRRSVKRDEQFVAAKKDYNQARVARVAASAYLDGALDARDIALDYAYWLHRYDPYRFIGTPYGYPIYDYNSGYGYGGSSLVYNPIYRPWR